MPVTGAIVSKRPSSVKPPLRIESKDTYPRIPIPKRQAGREALGAYTYGISLAVAHRAPFPVHTSLREG